jgi:hypothetical protein
MSTDNPSNSKIRVCKSVNGVTGRMIWFGKRTVVRMVSSTSYNKSDGSNCQPKVEMSPNCQSRDVPFGKG